MFDFLLNLIINFSTDINDDKIDDLIKKNIFKTHESGLLYCIYEPIYNEFPLKTIIFFNGMSSIYNAYKLFFKIKPNYRILFFQNMGRYKSNQNIITVDNEIQNYENTINIVKSLIFEMNLKNPIFIGYSYGTYGTIKISSEFNSKLVGLISPFDLATETSNYFNDLDCIKLIENSKNTKFIVLYGDKDVICPKTPKRFSKLTNCVVFDIKSKHSFYEFGDNVFDRFVRILIKGNC